MALTNMALTSLPRHCILVYILKGLILTQEYLKERLLYNADNGLFTWIKSKPSMLGKVAGTKQKYISIKIDGKRYLAHRLAWLYEYGYIPEVIDHINRDKTDNRLLNLRKANKSINARNRGVDSRNKSGVLGVSFCKQTGKWKSCINIMGKNITLGRYSTIDEAAAKRREAEIEHKFTIIED